MTSSSNNKKKRNNSSSSKDKNSNCESEMALQRKSINHQRQNLDFHTGPTNCLLGRWSSFIIRTPLFFSLVTINEYCTISRISIHHNSLFSIMFFLALLSILNLLIERERKQIKQKFQILSIYPIIEKRWFSSF